MFSSLVGASGAGKDRGRSDVEKISVCMATYNGSSFVERQIRSILAQLGGDDEVIIVDDASTDDTVEVVHSIQDSRIRILTSPQNRGHVRAFESAIREATGQIVFLSDQDDEWLPGRVGSMSQALLRSDFVATNWESTAANEENRARLRASGSEARFRNLQNIFLGRASYFGCAMAIRSEALDVLLPFPKWVEAHDHWIAIAGNVAGSMTHLEAASVRRTIHQDNLTPRSRRSIPLVIRTRLIMSWLLLVATSRVFGRRA